MGRELLLIDSNRELAEALRRVFSPAGFRVATLTTGEPALERCRASRPDIVLLAAELPDMSGFSACNRIKRAIASLPLILYTPEGSDAAVEAHRQTRTHADEYLRAPFDPAEALRMAVRLVDGAGAEASGCAAEPAAAPAGSAEAAPPPRRCSAEVAVPSAQQHDALELEWPRDPAPPRGALEDKLEFFRGRLRAKDAFLARVKEAMAAQAQDAAELRARLESLQAEAADASRARLERERLLGEARAAAEDAEAQRSDAERRLAESETTRQALSEVLSETMQHTEQSEREWAHRLAVAEDARAELEGRAGAESSAAAAELEVEREARVRLEAELESQRLALESQLASARDEREAVARELAALHARIGQQAAADERQRGATATALAEVEDALTRAREELEDLRSENDFLNTEIARYQQKNRELSARAGKA